MEKWAEWVAVGLTLIGSLIIFFRGQQKAEDRAESVSTEIKGVANSIHELSTIVQSIKVEIAEIKTEIKNRNALTDERHKDSTVDLEDLKGIAHRHAVEINNLKVWQAGADERLKIERARGNGD